MDDYEGRGIIAAAAHILSAGQPATEDGQMSSTEQGNLSGASGIPVVNSLHGSAYVDASPPSSSAYPSPPSGPLDRKRRRGSSPEVLPPASRRAADGRPPIKRRQSARTCGSKGGSSSRGGKEAPDDYGEEEETESEDNYDEDEEERLMQDEEQDEEEEGGGPKGGFIGRKRVRPTAGGEVGNDDDDYDGDADDENDNDEFGPSNSGSDSPAVEGRGEENDCLCFECRGGGSLLCCDGCVRSYHSECVPVADRPREPPDDDWFCPECRRKTGEGVALKKRGYDAPDDDRTPWERRVTALSSQTDRITTGGLADGGRRTASGERGKSGGYEDELKGDWRIMGGRGGITGRRRRSPLLTVSPAGERDASPPKLGVGRPRRQAVKAGKRTSEGNTTNSKINIGPQYQTPGLPQNFLEGAEYGVNYGVYESSLRTQRMKLGCHRGLNECRVVFSPTLWQKKAFGRFESALASAQHQLTLQHLSNGTPTTNGNCVHPQDDYRVQPAEPHELQEPLPGGGRSPQMSSISNGSYNPCGSNDVSGNDYLSASDNVSGSDNANGESSSGGNGLHGEGVSEELPTTAGGVAKAAVGTVDNMGEDGVMEALVRGKDHLSIRREFVVKDLALYLEKCERNWPDGLQWNFSPEFALKLLHFFDYDPFKALRALRDPHLNFQEACDPPLRPYMNKWRPRDRRGQIPSVPFPPPTTWRRDGDMPCTRFRLHNYG